MRRAVLLFPLAVVCFGQTASDLSGSFVLDGESATIRYNSRDLADSVSKLRREVETGKRTLAYNKEFGYLPALLDALQVPVSSQMLVFSKTSLQLHRIHPNSPRAIYFNDDVYVGYVPGGEVLELSAVDPKKGAIFYTVDQDPGARDRFLRRDDCLQCHASPKTLGVPGHLVRSVWTAASGYPIFTQGGFVTDHRSPFPERWGGWYVTGTHGEQKHMGNLMVRDGQRPEDVDLKQGANVVDLASRFDRSRYLSPHSDIVALMTLEHQARVHNVITRVGWEARIALEQQEAISKALGEKGAPWSESTRRRIYGPAETLVENLLFRDEAPLTAPVKGTAPFDAEFARAGKRDSQGRSLRDFDLTTRLMKHRLSWLIYTEAFDQLPDAVLDHVYARLASILTSTPKAGDRYADLPVAERRAIHEILLATKPAYARRAGTRVN